MGITKLGRGTIAAWLRVGLSILPCAQPASGEAMTLSDSTAVQAADDPSQEAAEAWLEKIEQRAADITTLQAEVRYDRIQGLVGDSQRRFGSLVYVMGPPARFAVHFDLLLADTRLDRQDRRYIFDGQWLVERYDNEKLFIKRQIVPPPVPGEEARPPDVLALGAGPFAVPITQKKDEVLRQFEVAIVEPQEGDPENSVHLKLTPRFGKPTEFTEIDVWYNRESLLPLRVRTIDESENESVIQLSNVRLNDPVEPVLIDTAEPADPGWRVEVTLYDEQF